MSTTFKFLVTVTALTLSFSGASAQSSIGLRGGFAMYTLKNMPLEQPAGETIDKVAFGNYSAVSFELGISKFFALQPEVTYIQKSGKVSAANTDDFSFQVRMDYLEVPVLAKFRFGSGPFRGYLTAGPSIGYALNGRSKVTLGDFSTDERIVFDKTYGIDGRKDNRIDIGLAGGGGVQYRIGPGSLVLDARLALDLNDYSRFEGDKPQDHKATRWQGLAASLGYQVEFGGK